MKSNLIIQVNSYEDAKKKLSEARGKNTGKLIGFTSQDDELNRKILEKLQVNFFMPILSSRKDWQKQRNSGLDNVMAREASKKGIFVGINFDEILKTKGREKSEILSRVIQNVEICNKNKVKMFFVGGKDAYDLKSLGLVLGMPTWMIKDF